MSECIPWQGYINSKGYGVIRTRGEYRNKRAHRVAYEEAFGPIPEGHVIDHRCHNEAVARGECAGGEECPHRRCVNPDHLEAVSHQVNIARGALGYESRSKCRKGVHDITETDAWFVGVHGRQCRGCIRDRNKERAAARKRARQMKVVPDDRA